ncbi:hypothetical protein ACIBI7_16615 [Nonomuraea fuscirosea]|uniref:hypothetical protein n=1 Tax=Nonomuraea fuscirosea TaxID=1291556 RepID=UPI00379008B2
MRPRLTPRLTLCPSPRPVPRLSSRPVVRAVLALTLTLAAGGCAKAGLDEANRVPQNDGANADVGDSLRLRNVFLLRGAGQDASAPPETLFGVLVNEAGRPDQVERITVEGGGSVQLAGPLAMPPNQPVGTGNQPLGTVSGVRAETVPMTFTFKDAKPVRLMVPVKTRTGHFADLPAAPQAPPSPTSPATAPPPQSASPSASPSAE